MKLFYFALALLCFCIENIFTTKQQDLEDGRMDLVTTIVHKADVESLPYGVYMKKVAILDLSSSTWKHVFKVPHLPAPPIREIKRLCDTLPNIDKLLELHQGLDARSEDLYKDTHLKYTKKNFCKSLDALTSTYKHLLNYTQQKNMELYQTLDTLTINRLNNYQPLYANWGGRKRTMDHYKPYWNATRTLRDTTKALQQLNRTNQDFKKTQKDLRRVKRGLVDFIGSGLKYLFGLSTQDDYSSLAQTVQGISNRQDYQDSKFLAFESEMRSVTAIHWERMDYITEVVNKTLQDVRKLQRVYRQIEVRWSISNTLNAMYLHIIMEIIGDMVIAHQALVEYQGVMRDRASTMIRLNQGYLSSEIVSVKDIIQATEEITPVLHRDYSPFQFAYGDPNYFYSVPCVTYASDQQYLYIQVQMPLSAQVSNYHVYEVLTVPLKASTSNTHYTQLTNLPMYAGFSESGDTYTTLDDKFLSSCLGHGIKRCPSRIAEISTAIPSCILALFTHDSAMAQNYCTTDLIIATSLAEQILDIGQGKFFLSANATGDNWVLNCPDQRPRITEPCSGCVISLGCRCSLKTTSAFISASLHNCDTNSQTTGIQKQYIPNLIWLAKLQDFSGYSEFQYNMSTFLLEDPASNLPDLPLPSYQDIQAFTDKNSMIRTSLDRVIQAAKHNQPVYVSKMQEFTDQSKWLFFKTKHALPMAFLALIWLTGLTVVFVIFGRYFCFMIVTMKHLETAQAAVLEVTPTTNLSTTAKACLIYLTVVLTFCTVLQIFWSILKFRDWYIKSRKCYPLTGNEPITTGIYLKLWTPYRLVTLYVDQLVIPNYELNVKPGVSNVISCKVHYLALKVTLHICWSDIVLQHMGLEISLPTYIKVPRYLTHLTDTIIKDKHYQASLLFKTGPLLHEHKFHTEKFTSYSKNPNAKSRTSKSKKYPVGSPENPHPGPPKPPRNFSSIISSSPSIQRKSRKKYSQQSLNNEWISNINYTPNYDPKPSVSQQLPSQNLLSKHLPDPGKKLKLQINLSDSEDSHSDNSLPGDTIANRLNAPCSVTSNISDTGFVTVHSASHHMSEVD